MNCPHCGKEIKEDLKFCPYCGYPLKEDDVEYFIRLARELRAKGKVKDAIVYCEKAISIKEDPFLRKNLGDAYYLMGILNKAIFHLKRAIELNPSFPDAHYSLAVAYFQAGMLQEAIKEFEKTLEINPQFSMVYYWLGHAYYHIGELPKSVENFSKLLEKTPIPP